MVLVQQLDQNGCAIACLAMLLGCDYYTMRSKLDTCGDILPRWGYPHFKLKFLPKEIIAVLNRFGIGSSFIKWTPDNFQCILLITPVKNPEYTHAVLYHGGDICDPMITNPQPLSHLDDYHVYCCIGVNNAIST